jgi:ParB family chromosome partitioning protein
MTLPLDDLSLLDGPGGEGNPVGSQDAAAGQPLQLPLDMIDEDPDQPRREFDEASLRELSETIALRGVRQPVSVRPHPTMPGRWMLNFGARRYRASRLAGKETIPAFVDATADSFDQVIENEQRQSLTPLELALFVQRQRQAGLALAEIARRLGKTRGYLTFVGALIDPPPWLLTLYRSGACTGMTELYELRKLHEQDAARVDAWLRDGADFTRAGIAGLKAQLKQEPAVRTTAEAPVHRRRAEAIPPPAAATRIAAQTITTADSETRSEPRQLSGPGDDAAGDTLAPEPVASLRVRWQSRLVRVPLATHLNEAGQVVINVWDETGAMVAVRADELEFPPVLGLVIAPSAV